MTDIRPSGPEAESNRDALIIQVHCKHWNQIIINSIYNNTQVQKYNDMNVSLLYMSDERVQWDSNSYITTPDPRQNWKSSN